MYSKLSDDDFPVSEYRRIRKSLCCCCKQRQEVVWSDHFAGLTGRNDCMIEAVRDALKMKKKYARVFVIAGQLHAYPFIGKETERFETLSKSMAERILIEEAKFLKSSSAEMVCERIEERIKVLSGLPSGQPFNLGQTLEDSPDAREYITTKIIQSQVRLFHFLSKVHHTFLYYPETKTLSWL